jgi:hypothetical protein
MTTTTAVSFSPLTTHELADRSKSHAFMAVGALAAWADGPRNSEPDIATCHARKVIAYQDALEARYVRAAS